MMRKLAFFLLLVRSTLPVAARELPPTNLVEPSDAVVAHDEPYFVSDFPGVELIYTERHLAFARDAAALEVPLNQAYQRLFGFALDETLHVGLISERNQIANGFSTQIP